MFPAIEPTQGALRIGLRRLVERPWLSITAIATLAVGLSATMAVFAIVNAFIFVPPVAGDASSFFRVRATTVFGGRVSPREYAALSERLQTVQALAAQSIFPADASLNDAEDASGDLISCNYFGVFNARALAGRLFEPGDCALTRPAAVLSETLWRTRFGAEPDIVGQSVRFGGQALTVIGVAGRMSSLFQPDLWLPYTLADRLANDPDIRLTLPVRGPPPGQPRTRPVDVGTEDRVFLELFGRLADSYSRTEGTAELRLLTRQLGIVEPDESVALTDGSLGSFATLPAWFLAIPLFFPAIIVGLACMNVSSMLLGRAIARRAEMSVRRALGATPLRLLRQLLVEHSVLVVFAVLAAVCLTTAVLSAIRGLTALDPIVAERLLEPDWRVFVFLAVSSGAVVFMSGLSPAFEAMRPGSRPVVAGQHMTVDRTSGRIRNGLLAVQIAVCILPVTGVVLLMQVNDRLQWPDLPLERVAEVSLTRRMDVTTAEQTLASVPGTEAIAFARERPLTADGELLQVVDPEPMDGVLNSVVSPAYFATLGIDIVAGDVPEEVPAGGAPVAPVVVSERLASELFPDGGALGGLVSTPDEAFQIVAISENQPIRSSWGANDGSIVYRLSAQPVGADLTAPLFGWRFLVRFDRPAAAYVQSAMRAMREVWPQESFQVSALGSELEAESVALGIVAMLVGGASVVAVLLAVVGIVGVMSCEVRQREREMAIRVALGASWWNIVRVVALYRLKWLPIWVAFGWWLSTMVYTNVPTELQLPAGDGFPYLVACGIVVVGVIVATMVSVGRLSLRGAVSDLRSEY